MLILFAFSGVSVISLSLFRATDTGMNASLWAQASAGILVVFFALFRNRLPYILKVWFLVGLPMVLGIFGVYSFGLIDGSVMLLITAVIVAATLADIRSGFLVAAFSTVCLVIIFLMIPYSENRFQVDETVYMYSASSWLVYIAAFSVLSMVTSILIGRISGIAYQNMKELELQAEELARANNTKDKLFQVIAHDLRSPFQGMIGGLEFFADEGDSFSEEQKQKLFKSMLRDATSTFSMLENLLFWSKVQIGELEIDRKYFEVDGLVNDALAPFERLAKQKNISISKQLAIGSIVFADERSVKNILTNLIHNAIKFSEKGGQILISAQTKDKQTSISISDTGVGISAGDQQHLFDKQEVKVQRGTDKEKGTGLGLSLSYELALLNDGQIRFESNSQGGSVFILDLPAMVSGSSE